MTEVNWKRSISMAAAALALGVQGCSSTMSKNECLSADWYAIGYEAGIRGQRETQITGYRKACGDYGVTPDLQRFLAGRDAGLQRFCEPRNGYRVGRAGGGYGGVCPQPIEAEFLRAYNAGRELYEAEQTVNRLGQRLHNKQAELKHLHEHIAHKQADLIAVDTPPPRRVTLLSDVLELRDKVTHVEHEIYDARIERDRARARLDYLQRRTPAW